MSTYVPDSTFTLTSNSRISAATQSTRDISVFAFDTDGCLKHLHHTSASPLPTPPSSLAQSALKSMPWELRTLTRTSARPGALACTSLHPPQNQIFWFGPHGSVETQVWDTDSGFRRYQIAPDHSASAHSDLCAISSIEHASIHLFWVSERGSIQHGYWNEQFAKGNWNIHLVTGPSAASLGSRITATYWEGSPLIFYGTVHGAVEGARWKPAWHQWMRWELAPPGSLSSRGGLTAFTTGQERLDVCWVSVTGGIEGSGRNSGSGPWKRFRVVGSEYAEATSDLVALQESHEITRIFFVGSDLALQMATRRSRHGEGSWNYEKASEPGHVHPTTGLAVSPGTVMGNLLWYADSKGLLHAFVIAKMSKGESQ